ncbi:MAG TPA: hypothetical protein VM597_39805 [Gemmataceae bacterium]|jgi:hypothetical protein|nr:hypothetical protein [Gemmataceae bacterium]
MRLLCPHCQESLTVPDSEGGKTVHCTYCGKPFSAPLPYEASSPALAAEPLPPASPKADTVPAPFAPKSGQMPSLADGWDTPAPPRPAPELAGYANVRSVPLDPAVVRWIAPVALFVAFVLTFFSWNGLFPGGHAAYTQSAWGCLTGGFYADPVAEEDLKLTEELGKRTPSNLWLLPYLMLVIPTLVLAWAGPVVGMMNLKLPAPVENLWQYRPAALGGLAIVLLLFLSAQWASGFGLQRAIKEKAEVVVADERAAANTPEKVQKVEMKEAMHRAQFSARTTVWLRLAFLMHLLAALAVVAETGLTLRGNKPAPRLAAMW